MKRGLYENGEFIADGEVTSYERYARIAQKFTLEEVGLTSASKKNLVHSKT